QPRRIDVQREGNLALPSHRAPHTATTKTSRTPATMVQNMTANPSSSGSVLIRAPLRYSRAGPSFRRTVFASSSALAPAAAPAAGISTAGAGRLDGTTEGMDGSVRAPGRAPASCAVGGRGAARVTSSSKSPGSAARGSCGATGAGFAGGAAFGGVAAGGLD